MREEQIYFSGIEFKRNEIGQYLMYVKFSSGEVWCPAWKDVHRILNNALFVEKINKKLIGKGKPKTFLVFPILEILKSRGYLKESLFVFDMDAEVQETGIILGSRITLESENSKNFKELKKKAQRKFMDRMIHRTRDLPTFKDKLLKLTKIIVTEYMRKRTWEEPIRRISFSSFGKLKVEKQQLSIIEVSKHSKTFQIVLII